MELKAESKLKSMMGKYWMYRTISYKFTDFIEVGSDVIISTDVKALKIKSEDVFSFTKDCLPAEGGSLISKPPIDSGLMMEVSNGLLASFREIDNAAPEELDTVLKKASAKTKVAGAITKAAQTILLANTSKP